MWYVTCSSLAPITSYCFKFTWVFSAPSWVVVCTSFVSRAQNFRHAHRQGSCWWHTHTLFHTCPHIYTHTHTSYSEENLYWTTKPKMSREVTSLYPLNAQSYMWEKASFSPSISPFFYPITLHTGLPLPLTTSTCDIYINYVQCCSSIPFIHL